MTKWLPLVKLNWKPVGIADEGEAFAGKFIDPDWFGGNIVLL